MRFFHFFGFQLRLYLVRKRWLLPLPLIAFIAYRSANAVLALSQVAFGTARPNAWDLLFVALGNYANVYLAIGLLYIYLVCDLLPEPSLGQMLLFRLGSRQLWWWGKVLTLLVATLEYLLGITAFLAIIASVILPWEPGYSSSARLLPETVNLPMDFFRKVQPGPPLLHLAQELALLALGLFFIGLVMMVIVQLSRRYFVGLLTGFLILAGSLMTSFLSGPPTWWVYTPGAHFMYIGVYPLRAVPLAYSFLYWLVGITAAFTAGWIISRRQNHLAVREQEEG